MDAHNLFVPRGDESLLEGIIMTLLKKSMSKSKTFSLLFTSLNSSQTVSLMILKMSFLLFVDGGKC